MKNRISHTISSRLRVAALLLPVACVAFSFLLAIGTSRAAAQPTERCGFEWKRDILREEGGGEELIPFSSAAAGIADDGRIVIVPVVFHILYRTPAMNISAEQIMSQIDALNRDFRRQNADTMNTPAVFRSLGGDTRIEFRLANRDPNGTPTSGITRRETTRRNIGSSSDYFRSDRGGTDIWDRNRYLNIWVCEITSNGSILGFATQPGGRAADDGIVLDYRYTGTAPFVEPPLNQGRTCTHEVGHWFNLEHIWGTRTGCSFDDFVEDTPQQEREYYGCQSHPQTSCGSQDMFMNYMDYGDDPCLNIFTRGQIERMRAALFRQRTGLLTSNGYDPSLQISEQDAGTGDRVYPLPAREVLYADFAEAEKTASVVFIDMTGRTLPMSFSSRGNRTAVVPVEHLPSGVYRAVFADSHRRTIFSATVHILR